jgi:hypothetical protein
MPSCIRNSAGLPKPKVDPGWEEFKISLLYENKGIIKEDVF